VYREGGHEQPYLRAFPSGFWLLLNDNFNAITGPRVSIGLFKMRVLLAVEIQKIKRAVLFRTITFGAHFGVLLYVILEFRDASE